MDGDVTRSTYARLKHYRSVLMQQGRVQRDADWNEEFAILSHREQAEIVDAFGQAAVPWYDSGFHIVTAPAQLYAPEQVLPGNQNPAALAAGDFYISAGRMYVNGILCENERICTWRTQPDLPAPRPPAAGAYLVYLHVWMRHITWLDDSDIREVALGGPDTATRWKTVWQVGLQSVPANSTCASVTTIAEEIASPVTLEARAEPDPPSDDPCIVAPGAGYRGLKNETYRVEIHQGGAPGTATFKWARNNASIESAWLAVSGNDLTVADIGRDPDLSFAKGLWVELLDDDRILTGRPGTYAQIAAVNGNVITIDPVTVKTGTLALAAPGRHPRVKLWHSPLATVSQPGTNSGFIALEDGVEVKFSLTGTARTGDNWEIPARIATAAGPANILWPPGGDPTALAQPPIGIRHHYAHLAVGQFNGTNWTSFEDCRKRFAPADEDIDFFFLGGDGQVAPVHGAANVYELPEKLTVGVTLGGLPFQGARVRFRVAAGGGKVNGASSVIVITGADGVAKADFIVDSTTPVQQVEATFLDSANPPKHLPVMFTARLLYADGVFYDPKNCVDLKEASTVQQAIDLLCKLLHAPPSIVVDGVFTFKPTQRLFNDLNVDRTSIGEGIVIACSGVLSGLDVGARPVCTLTIELPWLVADTTVESLQAAPAGYLPFKLAGTTLLGGTGRESAIYWRPTASAAAWLSNTLPAILAQASVKKILARLHVEGRFVWGGGDKETVYLDGTTFGRRVDAGDRMLDLILPSGDKRRVADFDMWFWLVDPPPRPLRVSTLEFWSVVPAGPAATPPPKLSSAGTVAVPVTAAGPQVHFAATEQINTIRIAFNQPIAAGGIVGIGQPQGVLLEREIPGAPLQHIYADLRMMAGSNSVVEFLAKDPNFINVHANYRLTVIGNPSTPPARGIPIKSSSGAALDGTFNNAPGADFVLEFSVS